MRPAVALLALAATLTLAVPAAQAAGGSKLWSAKYNGPANGNDSGEMVALSPDGTKVFVTGESNGGATSIDYVTIAYNASTGSKLWSARFNGPASGLDVADAIAVAHDGTKVFVTGYADVAVGASSSDDYATVAYNASTGAKLWSVRYNGPGNSDDLAQSIAANPDGTSVFVTGDSYGTTTGRDYATVAYNANTGTKLWSARYDGPASGDDYAYSITVSSDGTKTAVTGQSPGGLATGDDVATLAYNAATGAKLWTSRLNGPASGNDVGNGVAFTPDGTRVLVAGRTNAGMTPGFDALTLALSASTGVKAWSAHYNGLGSGDDEAVWLAVSSDGTKLFIAGDTYAGATPDYDYLAAAYSVSSGTRLWTSHYDGPGHTGDYAYSVAFGGGKVVVTGQSGGGTMTGDDAATVAYSASGGGHLWTARNAGVGAGTDWGNSVAINPAGTRAFVNGGISNGTLHADVWTAAYQA